MPRIDQRLVHLDPLGPEASGAFLAAALPHARPEERASLAQAAIATGAAAALAEVIRDLHRHDDEVREALRGAGIPARAAAALLAEGGRPRSRQLRRNIVELAHLRADVDLLDLLVPLLADDDRSIAAGAAAALLAATRRTIGDHGRRVIPLDAARGLDRALAAAAGTFREHRRPEALVAAGLFSGRGGGQVDAALADRDHPLSMGLRGLPRRLDEPLVRANLLRWLATEALGPGASRALHRVRGTGAWADVLHDAHLLLSPPRRRALGRVVRPLSACPTPGEVGGLPLRSQVQVPGMLAGMDVASVTLRRRLGELVTLPSPVARLRVVHHLASHRPSRVADALAALAADPSPAVAHRAAQLDRGREGWMGRQARSSHPLVARRALVAAAGADIASFFGVWRRIDRTAACAAARTLVARDRAGFVDRLAGVLHEGVEDQARLPVVLLARRLGLVADLFESIARLAGEASARLASAAVSAVSDVGPSAQHVLVTALGHRSPRVQANAIEALARVAVPRLDVLVEPWLDAPGNRPRANAIKAVLGAPGGGERLRRMLLDPRPLHRLSAAWVARTARVAALHDVVLDLARRDPAPEVRVRCAVTARFLAARPDRTMIPA